MIFGAPLIVPPVTLFYLLLAALFLAANAFFVLAEFAIVKVRATRLAELAAAGDRRATLAQKITGQLDAYLAVCQLGITIASLGLGWLGEPAFARLIEGFLPGGPWGPALSHTLAVGLGFALITFLHILLGEQVPKSIGIRHAERSALATARPLHAVSRVLRLPMTALAAAQNWVLRLLRLDASHGSEGGYSEQELRLILSLTEERGALPLGRLLLFENLFDFGKLKVADAMIPIDRVERIRLADGWERISAALKQSSRTRLLVYADDPARPAGVLHVKDLWRRGINEPAPPDIRGLMRPVPTLPERMPLEAALREFQKRRSHLMVVVDEKGRPTGILTMEDVLEELVGSIEDEFERHAPHYLADIIPPAAVVLDLAAATPEEAVRELAVPLAGTFAAGLDSRQITDAVWARAQGILADLGNGVAIPHARLPGLKAPIVALGRSASGVRFDARHEDVARLVFLILTPEEQPRTHVQVLARVAGLVESAYVRERLLAAGTPAEALEIIRSSDPITHTE